MKISFLTMKAVLAVVIPVYAILCSNAGFPVGSTENINEGSYLMAPSIMQRKSGIGPQEVVNTPIEKGTFFVSPKGTGDCTQGNPCSIETAKNRAEPGNVIFLSGGTYVIDKSGLLFEADGTSTAKITYESLPGEQAIFDGSALPEGNSTVVTVSGDWSILRNLTFRNFPENGVRITGNHNLLDGIIAYDNKSSGIHVWGTYDHPYGAAGSWNTVQNSICYANSDAGLTGGPYNDGDNADGISVSSGEGNRIINNLTYGNSDDGIDVWRSTNSLIAKNISHNNGKGEKGNGNGIKAGGAFPGEGAMVFQNLAYNNRRTGFDHNSSPRVSFYNNTSFDNYRGYVVGEDNTVINNISFEDEEIIAGQAKNMTNNSWQLGIEDQNFLNQMNNSEDFLHLKEGSTAIDAGINVGLHYYGKAPDLGAIEHRTQK